MTGEEEEMEQRDVSRRGTGTRGPGGVIGLVVGSRGIEWVCWGRPGENVGEWQARFRAMCTAFDEAGR